MAKSTSALDVADTLLQVLQIEATRLLDKARDGELEVGDRISLSHYLREAQACAADEWRRLREMDPKAFTDEMLARICGEEKANDEPPGKPRRFRQAA